MWVPGGLGPQLELPIPHTLSENSCWKPSFDPSSETGGPTHGTLMFRTAANKERLAIVLLVLLMLGLDWSLPRVSAAACAIACYWWLAGLGHSPPEPPAGERG